MWGLRNNVSWSDVKSTMTRCKKWRKFGLYLEVEEQNNKFGIILWGPDMRKNSRAIHTNMLFSAIELIASTAQTDPKMHVAFVRLLDKAVKDLKVECRLV